MKFFLAVLALAASTKAETCSDRGESSFLSSNGRCYFRLPAMPQDDEACGEGFTLVNGVTDPVPEDVDIALNIYTIWTEAHPRSSDLRHVFANGDEVQLAGRRRPQTRPCVSHRTANPEGASLHSISCKLNRVTLCGTQVPVTPAPAPTTTEATVIKTLAGPLPDDYPCDADDSFVTRFKANYNASIRNREFSFACGRLPVQPTETFVLAVVPSQDTSENDGWSDPDTDEDVFLNCNPAFGQALAEFYVPISIETKWFPQAHGGVGAASYRVVCGRVTPSCPNAFCRSEIDRTYTHGQDTEPMVPQFLFDGLKAVGEPSFVTGLIVRQYDTAVSDISAINFTFCFCNQTFIPPAA